MFLKDSMKEGIDYFQDRVNTPLMRVIILLGNRYPKPTKENCHHPNSLRLLDIRDKFFKEWDLGIFRNTLIKALFRIVIVKYEHSPTWRNMLDWAIKEIPDDWKPFNINRQMKCWKGKKDD